MKIPLAGWLFVSISAITLGITNFLFPRASRVLGAANATFFYYVSALALALGYWLLAREPVRIRWTDMQWPLLMAAAMFASNLTYSYAVRYFDTTFPAVLRGCSFFVTAFLAFRLSGEVILVRDWLALVLVAAGLALFATGHPGTR